MTKLLFIKASPRDESRSVAIAQAHVDALAARMPGLEVDTLALWDEPLPQFDGDKANAKLAIVTGQDQTAVQRTAWDEVLDIARRFTAADLYVFAIPMWNGGIPYRLKHLIDIVHQPGITFRLDPATGYHGLLSGRRAVLVYTAGAWGPSMPSPAYGTDNASPYMRAWLAQAGITDIAEIRFQPVLLNPDRETAFAAALSEARALAA